MISSELNEVLKNESLDVLQKIFDYMAEELSEIKQDDKMKLEKINNKLDEKFHILKQQFNELEINKRDMLLKVFEEYVSERDYLGAYYNQKYFKEGVKIGIKLMIESIK